MVRRPWGDFVEKICVVLVKIRQNNHFLGHHINLTKKKDKRLKKGYKVNIIYLSIKKRAIKNDVVAIAYDQYIIVIYKALI